jgi:hypothetical protein
MDAKCRSDCIFYLKLLSFHNLINKVWIGQHLLVPYRYNLCGGIGFIPVCPSVCLFVHPQSFTDFFSNMSSYFMKTLYMVLYLWLTVKIQKWLLLTISWKSYAPFKLAILRDFTVSRTFLRDVSSYCIETLYMALYLWRTNQVQRWLLLTTSWTSYIPLNLAI